MSLTEPNNKKAKFRVSLTDGEIKKIMKILRWHRWKDYKK
ncbi:hypothetical protein NCCP28_04530 [Niallia sp. NCCP-28]|nr:hypothetical protein NCCP28_04530 [Niallia sp. NCCP-28]